jgi:hypothetical protein
MHPCREEQRRRRGPPCVLSTSPRRGWETCSGVRAEHGFGSPLGRAQRSRADRRRRRLRWPHRRSHCGNERVARRRTLLRVPAVGRHRHRRSWNDHARYSLRMSGGAVQAVLRAAGRSHAEETVAASGLRTSVGSGLAMRPAGESVPMPPGRRAVLLFFSSPFLFCSFLGLMLSAETKC